MPHETQRVQREGVARTTGEASRGGARAGAKARRAARADAGAISARAQFSSACVLWPPMPTVVLITGADAREAPG